MTPGTDDTRDAPIANPESGSEILLTPSSDSVVSVRYPEPVDRPYPLKPLQASSSPLSFPKSGSSTRQQQRSNGRQDKEAPYGSDLDLDESDDPGEMSTTRPPMHRPDDGRSQVPLLKEERGRPAYESPNGSARPPYVARRGTFRSRSPTYGDPANTTRRKYTYAAFFLIVSLVSFVIQTETAVYIQHTLGWKKAYCMLWLTHGSWSLLWPIQLLVIRIQKRKISWVAFWRRHKYLITSTAQMVHSQELHLTTKTTQLSPWRYTIRTTAIVASCLTVAGGSWYVAVDLTSPSDLTAIYNCSAFFAYVFSIMLLNDKLRFDKMFSVAIAIAGVLIVAYGDKEAPAAGADHGAQNRTLGNLVIGVGSVLYGLYEVLYKKMACPPEGTSPGRGMIFANAFGSLIGLFTLTVLWIPLPILHFTGVERFELPHGKAAGLLAVSTLSNAIFSGSFLVLMSLTSPVLSSVAALLTIFLVAIVDWFITGKRLSTAAIIGGSAIIVAFAMLSWATYREMEQERKKRENEDLIDSDDEID